MQVQGVVNVHIKFHVNMARYMVSILFWTKVLDSPVANIPASGTKPLAATSAFMIHIGQTLIYKPGLISETLTASRLSHTLLTDFIKMSAPSHLHQPVLLCQSIISPY